MYFMYLFIFIVYSPTKSKSVTRSELSTKSCLEFLLFIPSLKPLQTAQSNVVIKKMNLLA